MAWVATAIVGSTVVSSYVGSKSASKAADAQVESAEAGVEEQRRQFDEITKILKPYITAGEGALPGFQPFIKAGQTAFDQQQALTGLKGPAAQQAAIRQLEQSPEMQAMLRQGENALLQSASATGGLRGGNVQAALAQFRPALLAEQIQNQLQRLGGIASTGLTTTESLARLGQASASRQAAAGSAVDESVSQALGTMGAARAGQAIAQGQAVSNVAQSIPSALILSRYLPQSGAGAGTMTLGGGF
jgi:hypothetical protein